ncbi:MAG: hypothetical protein HYR84_16615 [Planctomycetes bacterium]|nr:hypothetical protein [Planctomycetota bacterium]
MITLRKEQFDAMTAAYLHPITDRWVARLRAECPDRLPASDEVLKTSITGWVEDARAIGINSEKGIWAYVENAARTEGTRAPLEVRLVQFVRSSYPGLAARWDVSLLVTQCLRLCNEHGIVEEEGAAWLAAIMVATSPAEHQNWIWLNAALASDKSDAESKLKRAHGEAQARGCIKGDGP